MKTRDVAIVIFYDKKFNIIVQERGRHSKIGEKYGFFGGSIKKGETPKQAIRRELFEEIGFVPKILDYWTKYSFIVKEEGKYRGWLVNLYVFLSVITPRLEKAEIAEGKGMIKMNINKAIDEGGFNVGGVAFLQKIKNKLLEILR